MVTKIILKNFMSHANSVAELSGDTIAVMGDNGAGKSAFLESLPYAYYGLGRENLSGMSRINGDGSHEVQVYFDDSTVISRGCKPSGTGFCTVHVNGELKGKGVSANAWIQNYLGMDVDTYMLTAFFGLKDVRHDNLINVTPSIRLETLQKIAKIGPYKAFVKSAKENLSSASLAYEKAQSRKEGAEESIIDIKETTNRLIKAEKQVKLFTKKLSDLKSDRQRLQVEEEKYQAFVKERERLAVERKGLRRELASLEADVADCNQVVSRNNITFDRLKADKEALIIPDIDSTALLESAKSGEEEAVKLDTLSGIRDTALQLDDGECPLCGSNLPENILDKWEAELAEMTLEAQHLRDTSKATRKTVREQSDLEEQMEDFVTTLKDLTAESSEAKKESANFSREMKKIKDSLTVKDNKYLSLSEKLGSEYQGLQVKMRDVSDDIDAVNVQLGDSRGSVTILKETLTKSASVEEKIKSLKADMKTKKSEMSAYSLLQSAWNRYGIPMLLIKDIMQGIEDRSTAVYQSFDNGRIEVREVEDRGKPGVQFFLVDRKGERTFNQLSEGEKVMFFIAVRVSIAQIVAESGVKVDYLILDEAMGNLSPARRDDLIRLINKVLRRLFPMVAMVSHTEMKDIFTQVIRISADNGESKIEVS